MNQAFLYNFQYDISIYQKIRQELLEIQGIQQYEQVQGHK